MAGFHKFVDMPIGEDVANADLPIPFEGIEDKTCIRSRQRAEPHATVESVADDLARFMLREEQIDARDCSAVILASCTADPKNTNGTHLAARRVAAKLGIERAEGVDFACTGFPAAVALARRIVDTDPTNRHAVLLFVELFSKKIVDWSDKNTALLFGDGAAGVLVSRDGPHEILDAVSGSIDDPNHLVGLEWRIGTMNAMGQKRDYPEQVIHMNGRQLFRDVPSAMIRLVRESIARIEASGVQIGTKLIAQHQANGRFAERIEDILEDSGDLKGVHALNAIADRGNIGAASIPSALARNWDEIVPGTMVFCPAKGAGPVFEEGRLTEGVATFLKSA